MSAGGCTGRAHPRLRGADRCLMRLCRLRRGSSPLTRGGLLWDKKFDNGDGLIPAYAGRTFRCGVEARPVRAHPRLRGADHGLAHKVYPPQGSSPLTRGGHLLTSVEEPKTRLADPTYGVTVSVGEHFGQHSSRYGVELLMAQWFFA